MEENAVDQQEDAPMEDAMRLVMPEWDASATCAREIYRVGLEKIFPPELLEPLTVDDMITQALMKKTTFNLRGETDYRKFTQSKTLYRMMKSLHLSQSLADDRSKAEAYARQMIIVLSLLCTYKSFRRTKCVGSHSEAEIKVLSGLRGPARNEMLASTIVNIFFTQSELSITHNGQSGQTCALDSKKLLCHLILLILTIVPKSHFDFQYVAEDLDETVETLKIYLEYVGCMVNTSTGLEGTLRNTFLVRKATTHRKTKKRRH